MSSRHQRAKALDQTIIQETCKVMCSQSVMDVIQERVEQIVCHGYDDEHDSQNTHLELARAATGVLVSYTDDVATGLGNFWPDQWSLDSREHVSGKTPYEMLTMAAAFILAEMDRIDKVAMKTRHDLED